MRLLLAVLLLCAVNAHAQGVSYIGLCNKTWNCENTLKTWRQRDISVGWLEDSFGAECSCADQLLRLDRPKVIRVHLANGPCLRNQRCEPHDVFAGLTITQANKAVMRPGSRVRRRFAAVVSRFRQRLLQSRNAVQCYVSPCLECDLNGPARKVLSRIVRARLPGCVLVDNPFRHDCLPQSVCEKHGPDTDLREPCIYDLDGTEVNSVVDLRRIAKKTARCDLRFYWSHWMNCNVEGQSFVEPSKRVCHSTGKRMQNAGDRAWIVFSDR